MKKNHSQVVIVNDFESKIKGFVFLKDIFEEIFKC